MQAPDTTYPAYPQVAREETMRRQAGIDTLVLWIVATTAGYVLSSVLGIGSAGLAGKEGAALALALGPLMKLIGSAVLALLQWVVMRPHIPHMRWLGWLLATLIGKILSAMAALVILLPLVFATGDLLEGVEPRVAQLIYPVTGGLIQGAILGFVQWLVLRRYIKASAWWIPANMLALAVVATIPAVKLASGPLTLVITSTASGLVFGIITGAVIVWLLRRNAGPVSAPQPSMMPAPPE